MKTSKKERQSNFDVPATIRYFRERSGMTQADVCRKTGYARTIISRLESGRVPEPKLDTIYTLCKCFNITIEAFTGKALELGGGK